MVSSIESIFANGMMMTTGDPQFIGILIAGFFMGAVFAVPSHPALKVFAFFGGVLLALPFIGLASLIWSFGLGLVIWFAFRRFWG